MFGEGGLIRTYIRTPFLLSLLLPTALVAEGIVKGQVTHQIPPADVSCRFCPLRQWRMVSARPSSTRGVVHQCQRGWCDAGWTLLLSGTSRTPVPPAQGEHAHTYGNVAGGARTPRLTWDATFEWLRKQLGEQVVVREVGSTPLAIVCNT